MPLLQAKAQEFGRVVDVMSSEDPSIVQEHSPALSVMVDRWWPFTHKSIGGPGGTSEAQRRWDFVRRGRSPTSIKGWKSHLTTSQYSSLHLLHGWWTDAIQPIRLGAGARGAIAAICGGKSTKGADLSLGAQALLAKVNLSRYHEQLYCLFFSELLPRTQYISTNSHNCPSPQTINLLAEDNTSSAFIILNILRKALSPYIHPPGTLAARRTSCPGSTTGVRLQIVLRSAATYFFSISSDNADLRAKFRRLSLLELRRNIDSTAANHSVIGTYDTDKAITMSQVGIRFPFLDLVAFLADLCIGASWEIAAVYGASGSMAAMKSFWASELAFLDNLQADVSISASRQITCRWSAGRARTAILPARTGKLALL